ncbi:RING finger protein 225 [Eublepharis macularius]|uniref:RING finger protein 225 n=1 Tax=Eublepharis macularius TaxID=481883 RepID=A0AA97JB48_EUBMA|nr:RING finger protein 225 [Eublepharis macularius]XP_054834231.1 RING finger protein 225 [Eublepharis macularius]XP_054834232.1 RING finger protein 225 [Eublepharis macularius]
MAHDNPRFQAEASQSENKEEEAVNSESGALDCVICFTPYDRLFKVPKELSCGHIFCLECLARINVSSEDVNALTCPVCRAPTSLPSRKGLPGLPTRSDLLEQLSAMPAPPGSVRFDRRRGLLYLPGGRKGVPQVGAKPGAPLNTVSLSVDVGRPAPRGPGRMLSLSGWPFYVALAIALLVTIGLIICGIYIFLLPSMYTVALTGQPPGNHSQGHGGGNHSNFWLNSRPPMG